MSPPLKLLHRSPLPDRSLPHAPPHTQAIEALDQKVLRRRELMERLASTQVLGRPTATGHCLAPGYLPLTATQMADVVAGMRAAYSAAGAGVVQAVKHEHRCGAVWYGEPAGYVMGH